MKSAVIMTVELSTLKVHFAERIKQVSVNSPIPGVCAVKIRTDCGKLFQAENYGIFFYKEY